VFQTRSFYVTGYCLESKLSSGLELRLTSGSCGGLHPRGYSASVTSFSSPTVITEIVAYTRDNCDSCFEHSRLPNGFWQHSHELRFILSWVLSIWASRCGEQSTFLFTDVKWCVVVHTWAGSLSLHLSLSISRILLCCWFTLYIISMLCPRLLAEFTLMMDFGLRSV
jgi:hypothetical protein